MLVFKKPQTTLVKMKCFGEHMVALFSASLGKPTRKQRVESAKMGLSDYLMSRFSITQCVLCWERVACRNEFWGSQLEYGGSTQI